MPAFSMHLAANPTPVAYVIPDSTWPDMWRIRWPDGKTSDMVNLSRAKDAAADLYRQKNDIRARGRFRWVKLDD